MARYRPGTCVYPGGFDFEDDATVARIPVGAVRVFAMLHQMPFTWTARNAKGLTDRGKWVTGTLAPTRTEWLSKDEGRWRDVVTAYAETVRLGDGTDQRRGIVELGNEPRWPDVIDAYLRKLEIASPILRASGKRVITAAPYPSAEDDFFAAAQRKGAWEHVDGVGLHPYRDTPAHSLDRVRAVRAKLDSFGGRATELALHLTEFGWATPPAPAHPFVVSEAKQAAYLKEAFANWKREAADLNVGLALWYILRDWPPETERTWVHYCGALREDGTEKPSYAALAGV